MGGRMRGRREEGEKDESVWISSLLGCREW